MAALKSSVSSATVARISSKITSGLIKRVPEQANPRVAFLLGHDVGAMLFQTLLRLLLRQALRPALEQFQRRLGRQTGRFDQPGATRIASVPTVRSRKNLGKIAMLHQAYKTRQFTVSTAVTVRYPRAAVFTAGPGPPQEQ